MLKLFWSLIVLHFLSFSQLIVHSPLSLSRPLPPPLSLSLFLSLFQHVKPVTYI